MPFDLLHKCTLLDVNVELPINIIIDTVDDSRNTTHKYKTHLLDKDNCYCATYLNF